VEESESEKTVRLDVCTVTEAAKDDSRTVDLELLCHSLSSTFSSVTDNTSQCRRPGRRRLPF
jgi:hypothetical protein